MNKHYIMCLGCVSDERINQHLTDQKEFLTATPDRKTELQKDNKYPTPPTDESVTLIQSYYTYDSVVIFNIEEFHKIY